MQSALCRMHPIEDLSIEKTRIRAAFSDQIVVQPTGNVDGTSCGFRFLRYNERPALWWKSVSGWWRAIHHSHSRPILASSSPYVTAIRPPSLTMPLFPSRISVVLSHHLSLEDRRTDERLSRARNAPFLFFTSGVPGRKRDQSIRELSFPSRGLAGIKLLPRRELMLPAVNSFYFSRWGHSAAQLASSRLTLPRCTLPANKGFLLQRRQSESDRPSFTA